MSSSEGGTADEAFVPEYVHTQRLVACVVQAGLPLTAAEVDAVLGEATDEAAWGEAVDAGLLTRVTEPDGTVFYVAAEGLPPLPESARDEGALVDLGRRLVATLRDGERYRDGRMDERDRQAVCLQHGALALD